MRVYQRLIGSTLTSLAFEEQHKVVDNVKRCVLHLGAHRTGTTRIQEFMYKRRSVAAEQEIRFIDISETRRARFLAGAVFEVPFSETARQREQLRILHNLQSSLDQGHRIFLSDENVLGTMESCLRAAELYPDVKAKLSRLGPALELFDCVLLSIRRQCDWWQSALSFLVQNGFRSDSLEQLALRIHHSSRGWARVVEDIQLAMPNAQIVVREFDYHLSNPKRQIRDATRWQELKLMKNIPVTRSNNSDRGRALLKRFLTPEREGNLFSESEKEVLKNAYQTDLATLHSLAKDQKSLKFLC